MNFIFIIYYLKNLDINKLLMFSRFTKSQNIGYIKQFFSIIFCVFRYDISILEYYYFRFFEKDHDDRKLWAGTGFMYKYQFKKNPKKYRKSLENKILFLKKYKQFIKRKFIPLEDLEKRFDDILSFKNNNIVLKNSLGQVGKQVEIIDKLKFNKNQLKHYMKKKSYDLIEEFIVQHSSLNDISPTSVNTIRIITDFNERGELKLIGAILRCSVGSNIDNLGSGGIAAPVNVTNGTVIGKGVFSDITKPPVSSHPISKFIFTDFEIPFWKEIVDLATKAALFDQNNKSIGWDIAITENGPELIEGNHNWCKLLWQLPSQVGMKKTLIDLMKL